MIAGELVGQPCLQQALRRAVKLQAVVEGIGEDAGERRAAVIQTQEGHGQIRRGVQLSAIGEEVHPLGVAARNIDPLKERQNPALGRSGLGDDRESELARLRSQDVGQQTGAVQFESEGNLSFGQRPLGAGGALIQVSDASQTGLGGGNQDCRLAAASHIHFQRGGVKGDCARVILD